MAPGRWPHARDSYSATRRWSELRRGRRPPTRSVDAAPTTACVPTTFLSHKPPTSTIGRRPSPSFPSDRAAPPWKPPSGEPPPSPVTKSGPPPHRPSLRPTAPPHRIAAHQNRRRRRAPRGSLASALGERPRGLAREGLWQVGLTHSNSVTSFLPVFCVQVRNWFLLSTMLMRVVSVMSKPMRVGLRIGILRLRAAMDDILFYGKENILTVERNHFCKL
jgi:hypothetical protein